MKIRTRHSAKCIPLLTLLLAFHSVAPLFAATLITKGPYLQAPGPNTMTIVWETLTNVPGRVQFGKGDNLHSEIVAARSAAMKGVSKTSQTTNIVTVKKTNVVDGIANVTTGLKTNVVRRYETNLFYVYSVALTNLKPATEYSYSVIADGIATPRKQFRTFGDSRKITFIAYGDTRSFPKIHSAIAAQFGMFEPEFILHTGDLVENGKDYGRWSREFFQPLSNVIDRIPILPVIGNHEEDATNYLQYFRLPNGRRWYSFDDGPVHVLSLDYHFEKSSRTNSKLNLQFEAQLAFASNDLRSARAPWKIVFLHYPVYNVGGHGMAWGHEHYLPLFRDNKVDLVIAGHSHLYERFRPVAPHADKTEWAMTHITSGGGGAELARSYIHPSLAVNASTNHYVVFEATRDQLKGKAITDTGTLLDAFEIRKSRGRLAPEYLARVYPEETLQLSLDASRSLTARLTARPSVTNDSHVMFNVQPLKGTVEAGDLEITLAPDSAKYYTMEPLRVKTPATKKEIVAWATLHSTGAKKITEVDGKEFSPTLVFQARAVAGSVETIVYGRPSRLSQTAATEWKKVHAPQTANAPGTSVGASTASP